MIATTQVLIISILIAIGYGMARKKIFTPTTGKELSYLLINIVTPALILNSFQIDYTPEKLSSLLLTLVLAFLSYAIVIAFSYLYCGRGAQNKVERLAITFSNAGFMGIPLIAGIYGDEGVFYASIMVIVFNIMFWTYGIAVIRGQFSLHSLRQILLSPTIIAVVLGIGFFVLQVRLPEPFYSVAKHLANLNTPLAMIVAGISISQSDLLSIFKNTRLYKILVGKLFLAPIAVAIVFRFLPAPLLIKEILLVQISCPVAAIIGITIIQHNGDSRSATEYFTLTTLVSMVTLPLLKMICGMIL